MTALAIEDLNNDDWRIALGRQLLDARKARYLSVDNVAADLNMMPCHIRLIESAQYDPASQQGMFLDLVEQYSQYADVHPRERKNPHKPNDALQQYKRVSKAEKPGFPLHTTAAMTAAVLVLAVFLPISKMALDSPQQFQPQFKQVTYQQQAIDVAATAESFESAVEPMQDELFLSAEVVPPSVAVVKDEPANDAMSDAQPVLTAHSSAPSGVAQHSEAEAVELARYDAGSLSLSGAASEREEPLTYPVSSDNDEFAVQEVSSFIESLRSLADRS